jgi:hypothetical protein
LPTGWVAPVADAAALYRTVEAVYPAAVADWHRERQGDLAPTDWASTAARQTGIYETLGSVDDDVLAASIEACCGDCARRRAWDAGSADAHPDASSADEKPADAHPPDAGSAGPCAEPCPFLLAAVHEFRELSDGDAHATDADGATHRTGPGGEGAGPVGAFDRADNRYRARYREASRRLRPEEVS